MSKLPSMPMFWADFFADTAHMSGEAAGIYAVLLGHAWLRGGSLPGDNKVWARLARVSHQRWTSIKPEILPFWKFGEDGLARQSRQVRDYEGVMSKVEAYSQNAIKGNAKRWGKKINDFNKSGIANAIGSRQNGDRIPESNIKKDSLNGNFRQEGRWVPTKRINGRIFKAGEKAPKYENQPVQFWEVLKPEDCA